MKNTKTLATMRETISGLSRELSHTQLAATLALTTQPDYKETIREKDRTSYVIAAFGLTRCEGGYVVIRFRCPGQRDSISFHLFDDWKAAVERTHTSEFYRVARSIDNKRYALLQPEDGSPVGTRYPIGPDYDTRDREG